MSKYPPGNRAGQPVMAPASRQSLPSPPGNAGAATMECKSIADELLRVLHQETSFLREFNSQGLLRILPTKELLLRELRAGLESLELRRGEMNDEPASAQLAELRRSLDDVQRVNRFNQVFIRGSLDYWQGLMAVFGPQTYSPRPGSSPAQSGPTPRGFTFSKEA